jgi:ABC-type transport system substrate-binding protein
MQRADAVMNHEVVHLAANTKYYNGRPRLDQFEIYAYDNQSDIRAAIAGREVNGAADITNVLSDDLGDAYTVTPAPLASGVYSIFNNKNAVLSDAKVRKALQIGTDTQKVREAAGGQVKALTLPYIADQVPGSENLAAPALNTAEAAIMLDDAGWKLNGTVRYKDGQPLSLIITTTKLRAWCNIQTRKYRKNTTNNKCNTIIHQPKIILPAILKEKPFYFSPL